MVVDKMCIIVGLLKLLEVVSEISIWGWGLKWIIRTRQMGRISTYPQPYTITNTIYI